MMLTKPGEEAKTMYTDNRLYYRREYLAREKQNPKPNHMRSDGARCTVVAYA